MERHTHVERLTEDRLIYAGPCVLYVVNATLSAAQHVVDIYDGMDAITGRLIQRIEQPILSTTSLEFWPGAEFSRGLFVHIPDNGDYCTVVWGTVHEAH